MSQPVNLLLRKTREERGQRAEECFFKAFQEEFDKPIWFLRVERSSQKEDLLQGIDAWLITDWGNVPLQIKSSDGGAQEFRRRGFKRIKVVVVAPGDTFPCIRDSLFKVIKGEIWKRSKGHQPPFIAST